MHSGYTVRPAQMEDVKQIEQLMYLYIVDFYQRPKPPEEKVRGLITMCLEEQMGKQFVVEQDGELIGFATLYFTFSTLRAQKLTVMNDLYVVESARGTGAAKDLFEACKSYTQQHGFTSMQWETDDSNHRAQRFYEKMGGTKDTAIHYWI